MRLEARPHTGIKTVFLEDVEITNLMCGVERKNILKAEVKSRTHAKPVTFVERFFHTQQEKNQWLKNWEMMHLAGLPVPPTVRISDRQSILVTNLKANGEEMYGKGILLHLDEFSYQDEFGYLNSHFQLRKIDRTFFKVMETQSEEITKAVQRLAEVANFHNIYLPIDDPCELLVKPDGSWRLVIVDLLYACQTEHNEAVKYNIHNQDIFLKLLKNAYRNLQEEAQKEELINQPA